MFTACPLASCMTHKQPSISCVFEDFSASIWGLKRRLGLTDCWQYGGEAGCFTPATFDVCLLSMLVDVGCSYCQHVQPDGNIETSVLLFGRHHDRVSSSSHVIMALMAFIVRMGKAQDLIMCNRSK